jgi:hypothetical protein
LSRTFLGDASANIEDKTVVEGIVHVWNRADSCSSMEEIWGIELNEGKLWQYGIHLLQFTFEFAAWGFGPEPMTNTEYYDDDDLIECDREKLRDLIKDNVGIM